MNDFIEKLKSRSPLIHNITNMVTINDVANIELACGARGHGYLRWAESEYRHSF